MKHILMMAGGTGGHVFPAISIAARLAQEGHQISWLGTDRGLEKQLVPDLGYALHTLSITGFRGKRPWEQALVPLKAVRAIAQAHRIIRKIKPDLLVGMGGFASGPGAVAGKLHRLPLVIHEQNAVAGTTNRILARFSDRILCAFPDTFSQTKVHVVGNPVRYNFSPKTECGGDKSRPLRIVVLGGSLGAKSLNEIMPQVIASLKIKVAVKHQAGKKTYALAQQAYVKAGVEAELYAFIDDMVSMYAWADVVVCRAGAMTVFELMAMGKPAIFIPFPHAIDDHQTKNARYMVDHGAAQLIAQRDLSVEVLTSMIVHLDKNRALLTAMAKRAHELSPMDSVGDIMTVCQEVMCD